MKWQSGDENFPENELYMLDFSTSMTVATSFLRSGHAFCWHLANHSASIQLHQLADFAHPLSGVMANASA